MKHYSSGLHSSSTSFPSKIPRLFKWAIHRGNRRQTYAHYRHEFKRWVRVCSVDEPIKYEICIVGIFTVPFDFKLESIRESTRLELDLRTTNLLPLPRLGCEILEARWLWKCILRRIWLFSDGLGLDRVLGESNLESKKFEDVCCWTAFRIIIR